MKIGRGVNRKHASAESGIWNLAFKPPTEKIEISLGFVSWDFKFSVVFEPNSTLRRRVFALKTHIWFQQKCLKIGICGYNYWRKNSHLFLFLTTCFPKLLVVVVIVLCNAGEAGLAWVWRHPNRLTIELTTVTDAKKKCACVQMRLTQVQTLKRTYI